MGESAAAKWLMQEAVDHLTEDNVGVYELLWLLRGSEFVLNEAAAKQLARQTAASLISTGAASLVQLRWPTNEIVSTDVPDDRLYDDTVFEPGQAGLYLALTSTEPA
ncbi:hypothetical protein [Nocardia iowensis]|uniref:Uncharacterized protein n=1 Tax=Nocardia iowensis TaxID=204891 RepID=A0ABX8RLG6_NOCIO|nr:hypothetical protein [Nocardia iowensis]QXN90473.1 hypothetical protein KV110_34585 [Nocardia iowensis]